MATRLNKTQKSLLLRFRDALKNANIDFQGEKIMIADHTTGDLVQFDLVESHDDDPMELFVTEYTYTNVRNAWVTNARNQIKASK